jgi:hypothetical protein
MPDSEPTYTDAWSQGVDVSSLVGTLDTGAENPLCSLRISAVAGYRFTVHA